MNNLSESSFWAADAFTPLLDWRISLTLTCLQPHDPQGYHSISDFLLSKINSCIFLSRWRVGLWVAGKNCVTHCYTGVISERFRDKNIKRYKISCLLYTALHRMQRRSCDENSVCPSVCLSVCPSNAWIVTKRKKNQSTFLYHTKEHSS